MNNGASTGEQPQQAKRDPRQAANELLARITSRDAEGAASLFAEQVDFLCAGSKRVPWIRPRRTRADMADFFATMNAHFLPEATSATLSTVVVDNEHVVIIGRVSRRLKSNGEGFTIPFALHLAVVDGLIVRYHIYEDSLTVATAVAA
jgi:uncharacterized protein